MDPYRDPLLARAARGEALQRARRRRRPRPARAPRPVQLEAPAREPYYWERPLAGWEKGIIATVAIIGGLCSPAGVLLILFVLGGLLSLFGG